jgi:hypothetical protein
MHRTAIWRQRGKEIGPKRQNAGRVDTQNAQNGDFVSTRQQRLPVATGRRGITAVPGSTATPKAPSAPEALPSPPEAPSAGPGSTATPEAPSAGMAKKVIFLPLSRLKQKNFAENRLKHRFLLADC